jgi:dCTP deaminase
MSVLGNQKIFDEIARGNIICDPLVPNNVKGTSIDVTLGEWYFETYVGLDPFGYYNPFSQEGVKKMFGKPRRALPALKPIPGIPEDHPIIMLKPRSRILAHTHEFIGIKDGTSEMRARSSWGRNGIGVCLCAGWGDPGFWGRWAMEIQNFNDFAVSLPSGERVAQIIFHSVIGLDSDYSQVETSKYQTESDLETLKAAWHPNDLLPRSYVDERRIPLPV